MIYGSLMNTTVLMKLKKKKKFILKCCGSKLYKGARCICCMESTKINHNISPTTTDSNKIYSPDSDKNIIIQMFNSNLKGKKYVRNTTNTHDGDEGHFIETQMGILINSNNAPDNRGFEQKKEASKISFGDWAANSYLFSKPTNNHANKSLHMSRNEFIRTFGSPNPNKDNRYSWSGSVFPTYGNEYNYAGQRIRFLDNEDMVIEYLYLKDTREVKTSFRIALKCDEPIVIAIWKKEKLKRHIVNKFGVKGFYICCKDKYGAYDKIRFGNPFGFDFFKNKMEKKNIILDSGMYEGNTRNYSQFRANKSLWYDLITEEY